MSARISRITLVFCVGVTLCSFASAGTFSSAVFTDTSGLDLTGDFPLAVDFNSAGDTTLGDATFIQDVGTFFGGTSPFNSGSTFPAGLQTIMDGGRFQNAGGVAANGTMTTSIPVTPGEYHRLQLLFHDPSKGAAGNAPLHRPMDITAEGDLLDNFSVLALQGAANTNGVVVTYDFLAGDTSLDLTISTIGNGGADLNPFINAFSVENFVPEPSTFGLAIFALVGLVAFSRRRHRAAVMACLVAVALTVGSMASVQAATFNLNNNNSVGNYGFFGAFGAYGYVSGTSTAGNVAQFGMQLPGVTEVSQLTIDQQTFGDGSNRHRIKDITIYTNPTTSFQRTLVDQKTPQSVSLPNIRASYLLVTVDDVYTSGGATDSNKPIRALSVDGKPLESLTNLNAGIVPTGNVFLNAVTFPPARATNDVTRSVSNGLGPTGGDTLTPTFFTRNAGQDTLRVTYAEPTTLNEIGLGLDAENVFLRDLPRFVTVNYDGGSELITLAGDLIQYGRYSLADDVTTTFLELEFPEGSVGSNWFLHGDANYGITEFQAFLNPVPEPSTLILALVGFVAVGTLSRRRSSRI